MDMSSSVYALHVEVSKYDGDCDPENGCLPESFFGEQDTGCHKLKEP